MSFVVGNITLASPGRWKFCSLQGQLQKKLLIAAWLVPCKPDMLQTKEVREARNTKAKKKERKEDRHQKARKKENKRDRCVFVWEGSHSCLGVKPAPRCREFATSCTSVFGKA